MNREGVHVNFTNSVVYTSTNIRKIMFIACIYILFYPELDEKSEIRARIEAGNHLHAVFALTAKQRSDSVIDVMTSPTSNQIVKYHVLF